MCFYFSFWSLYRWPCICSFGGESGGQRAGQPRRHNALIDATFHWNTLRDRTLPFVECVVRNQTPLAPREPFDVTVHIVLNDFAPLGRAYVETDEAEADEATIVENILSGQYSHPVRVIAYNTVEGWARDVTEDIARAVEQGAARTPLNLNRRAGVFSEDARRVDALFGRLSIVERSVLAKRKGQGTMPCTWP